MSQTRRLAAVLAADVPGYSRLIGADEGGTLERLKALARLECGDALARGDRITSYNTSQNEAGDALAGSGSKGPI
jgi:class 3 adenylate cyclase